MGEGAGYSLGRLAAALGATLEGDPSRVVCGVAPLEAAGPEHISFVTDPRYAAAARASHAGAFLAPEGLGELPAPVLRSRAPRLALIELLALFHPPATLSPGIDPAASVARAARVDASAAVGAFSVIEAGAVIGPQVQIYPLVYVGAHAEVGESSILYPHVVLREGVRLGRRVLVHAGAVIGADGFGYAFDGHAHRKIPQVGSVVIEDDVEIGANATVDRATLGATIVRRGAKIDNLVQVAHNVEIGEHAILAAQVGIAGSSQIGRGVVLAGQVGVADHLTVGDGVVVGAQAGVAQHLPAGAKMAGTPARPIGDARRIWAAEGRLPELVRRVRALERRLDALEGRSGDQTRREDDGD